MRIDALYMRIKGLLESDRKYRNSYKELFWKLWEDDGAVVDNCITRERFFMLATKPETLRRKCQMVRHSHPELKADKAVQELRDKKEKTKGAWIWNNQKPQFSKQHIEGVLAILCKKYENPADRVGEEWEKDKATGIRYRKMLDDLNNQFAEKLFNGNLTPFDILT